MKNSIITSLLAVLLASMTTVRAQNYPEEYLGLPGDNLNLYAVMDLFRNSETLEDFEIGLNDRESKINNLDLNGDNLVDYIAVSDYKDRKVHTIVLRAILGRNEYQDVAVITVEKLNRKKVIIQLIGDEALYGKNYIIEPADARRPNPGYYSEPYYADNTTVINNYYYDIYEWPVVVYIYNPHYSCWHSSWYWGYYPTYWDPWAPYYWDYYYGYHSGWQPHYYTHYHHCESPRYNHYDDFYYHRIRQHSPQVQHRIAQGSYRHTYSRPEQRSEGADLYTRTRGTRSGETVNNAVINTQGRRVPQSTHVQNPAAGTVTERRTSTTTTTGSRTTAGTAADRRAPATENRRSAQGTSDENHGEARRNSTSTESRAATDPAASQNNQSGRVSSTSGTGRPAATTTMRRESEQPVTVTRTTIDNRAEEISDAQARENERRDAEAREAQRRDAEARAAETERRNAEAREAQNRANEARAAEAREAQRRDAEARAAEARAAEARAAEAREAQRRDAEAKAAEARRNEAAQKSTSESGTVRSIRH